ncbi:LysR family transcriptional regulator [Pseudoalteromonas denitrificans]|uniref:DNA-binding transcriptional regulator, LysR family n=1 Tax=Pseudoalteromonas denitrificans DSM 6059 TaxID=1123010 RepID=A0A1I1NAK3_9GAMM|nr:LysR family transcriptional regulator [Pseudoalteromonas denitrificans]SFC94764.1 DNA-binding transcriptional regulator, LysR family [Pseudoalteromonas denitrificans DSM 6059]
MDELKRIGVFTKVIQAKSFSEAARQLGVAKSAVSKQISLLEQEVGVRLLNRSTRKLSLTEAGEIYYKHCEQIVNRAEIAINELRQYQHQPTGTLRVASPIYFGTKQLIPIIKELRCLYPLLKIELLLEDRIVNMVEEGIDLSIRIGWLQDSNLIAKKLCTSATHIFASSEYLSRYGTPKTPLDLVNHQWISLSLLSSPLRWNFTEKANKKEIMVQVNSNLKTNSVDAVISAAENGLGISALAKLSICEQLHTGKLTPILEDYELPSLGVYAVYPHREHLSPKVRVFMEFLEKNCRNAPWS